jgi:elongation factor P hydroxylase|tara:strand:+ start:612 stop:833 length:222 start_codon:yes stop_codon:yes gene_type:complete
MKFINNSQLEYRKAIKDGNIVNKGKDKTITLPANTTISFGEMTESRGKYSIVMTVVKDFGKGNVSKAVILNLV